MLVERIPYGQGWRAGINVEGAQGFVSRSARRSGTVRAAIGH